MISESKSTISNVIHDLEVILKGTKEKEQSQRLQKVINTLKEHSVTVRLKDTTITLITDKVDELEFDSEIKSFTVNRVRPVAVGLDEETIDENGVRYIDTKTVADYYGVSTETVRNWIKEGKISGRQLTNRGKWFIPIEEFEYLKKQKDHDQTEDELKQLLGEDFGDDWEVELDEE